MPNEWKVRLETSPCSLDRNLWIVRRRPTGETEVLGANNIVTTIFDGNLYPEPTLRLNEEMFRSLVDLVHQDHKPSEGRYTDGKLEATERHLEDMRKIVFDKR